MGKRKKSSRKGKKAWRTNISSKDVDNYVEKAAREERSGGSLDAVPNERIFFVDKSSDTSIAKKTTKHKERMLHCDSILERASLVPPLPKAPKKKGKSNMVAKLNKTNTPWHTGRKNQEKSVGGFFDIWGIEDKVNGLCNTNSQTARRKKAWNRDSVAAAVEVDGPGCSYNPCFDDHQEALGLAVAQEMEKVYQKELEPPPIPRTVPGTTVEEEDVYFLEVGDDDGGGADVEDATEILCGGLRQAKGKKLTRAEINKRKRRKEQLRVQEQSSKKLKVETDVLRLNEITREIESENEDKKREWMRRTISKQEKRALGPPRLGKHKFQPEPVQVLLSEEVTGSLRKLKGSFTLARDRYKSLQRQGLIEPRLPVKKRARKKQIYFEQGTKGHTEREMHATKEANIKMKV